MIGWPRREFQQRWAVEFMLRRAGASVPPDSHFIFWMQDGRPVWVVAFHSWLGKTVEATFASDRPRMLPRQLIRAGFTYAFVVKKREMFFATVNSSNRAALRLDLWLGFKELYRGVGLHDDGGDLIFLGMTKAECRWLKKGTVDEIATRAA